MKIDSLARNQSDVWNKCPTLILNFEIIKKNSASSQLDIIICTQQLKCTMLWSITKYLLALINKIIIPSVDERYESK